MSRKINLERLWMFSLFLTVLMSLLSYEINLYYRYYNYATFMVIFSGIAIFYCFTLLAPRDMFNDFKREIYGNKLVQFWIFAQYLVIFLGSFLGKDVTLSNLIRLIAIIPVIWVFYIFIPKNLNEKMIYKLGTFIIFCITSFSFIGTIIKVNGQFMGYTMFYGRLRSLFFDPNYFAALVGVAFLLSYNRKGFYKFIAAFNLIIIIWTGSRTAIIALIVTTILMYFYKKKIKIKDLLKIPFILTFLYFILYYLFQSGFFRTSQGLGSRDRLAEITFIMLKEEPFLGYGMNAVTPLLNSYRTLSSSTHNTYLDYALTYGIPLTIIYLLVIFFAMYRGFKAKIEGNILCVLIFLFIFSNSIAISLGGVGAISLIFTLYLGYCNTKNSLITKI
ncbi:O-antigen ligase family protein [Solibacillus isronensis]|uniref:O-antigen ligase family protein n=1 Tax=Solibacillus isronensis TaxID=412383 RepID=UPI0003118D1F|nr:O-antigen ligase family protein [Solibacillus isronensis]AMO84783.1 hypothetical protein SOLI23_04060 [Solibacillus silvestris]